jgi:hypothetical protein
LAPADWTGIPNFNNALALSSGWSFTSAKSTPLQQRPQPRHSFCNSALFWAQSTGTNLVEFKVSRSITFDIASGKPLHHGFHVVMNAGNHSANLPPARLTYLTL